jgi:hypothetical protein
MGFELFTEHQVKNEVWDMLHALKKADYAISDLSKEQVQKYADERQTPVKLRKLKDGRIKVWLA